MSTKTKSKPKDKTLESKSKVVKPTAKVTKNSLTEQKSGSLFMFDKFNYLLMAVGVVVVIVGFLLMVGGGSDDPNVFNAEELYSFQRITLAPIVVMLGFFIEVVAIMKKPKEA